MAESAPKLGDPLYKYDIIEKVWTGYVRRNRGRHSATCKEYFSDFVRNHRSYQFSITRIHDGTTHVMVDREMYEKMKAELERKTGASSLPDIYLIDMSSPSNVVERQKAFTSRQQFNEFVNGLEKENNNVRARARKNASDHSSKLRQMLTNQKEANFVAFDLEVYDKDRQTILEVGSVKFTLKDDDKPEYFHAIIEENLHLVNSNVGDNRDNFKFGTSQRMSLKEAAALLQEKIASADVLVVHAGANDDKYLADNDIKTAEKTTFDTQILALNLLPTSNPRMISWGLKKILEELLISFDQDILHNAGNDAHYTTMAFKRLVKKAMPGARF